MMFSVQLVVRGVQQPLKNRPLLMKSGIGTNDRYDLPDPRYDMWLSHYKSNDQTDTGSYNVVYSI